MEDVHISEEQIAREVEVEESPSPGSCWGRRFVKLA
jgi:hypothetical protein